MFIGFFYLLRARGFSISLNEWMTLMEAMQMELHQSSFSGFYRLCRAVLVKSEADYDKFDQVFMEFFRGIPWEGEKLPDQLLEWLNHPELQLEDLRNALRAMGLSDLSVEEILERFAERLKDQTEEHNGGNKWIGTRGSSAYGHSGKKLRGIRVGGESKYRSAFQVAGERRYRDFRTDNQLDVRQFQMAFRRLRQYSDQNSGAKTEFDVDGTIHDTCENAGTLQVCYKKPRKNGVKVLMLIDSGGSMDYYSKLCSMLFQAATRSNHFKELHVYYFHNCVYSKLYTNPTMTRESAVPTDWVLKNFGSEYKVILVGDAMMDPYELHGAQYDWRERVSQPSGWERLQTMKELYPHLVWLNPQSRPTWGDYWAQTYDRIAALLPMYPLSLEGLERGMKKLMVNR